MEVENVELGGVVERVVCGDRVGGGGKMMDREVDVKGRGWVGEGMVVMRVVDNV